jgi:hypothetical protein
MCVRRRVCICSVIVIAIVIMVTVSATAHFLWMMNIFVGRVPAKCGIECVGIRLKNANQTCLAFDRDRILILIGTLNHHAPTGGSEQCEQSKATHSKAKQSKAKQSKAKQIKDGGEHARRNEQMFEKSKQH